eukprot:gene6896-7674_t
MSYQRVDGDFVHQAVEKIGFGKFHIIVIATLGLRIFQLGAARVTDSVLEPFLLCEMHLSFFNASWIVTAKAIGQIFGSVIIGRISDLYGRKRVFILFIIVETIAYSLNALSNGYTMIIITRTVVGFFEPVFVTLTTYVIEILPARRRNVFSVLKGFGIFGGLYCVGIALVTLRHLSWGWFVAISNVLPLAICAFLVCFLPESPRFLFKSGQIEETVSVLTKIAEMNKCDAQDFAEFVEGFKLDAKQSEKENSVNLDEKDFTEPSCEELEEPTLSNITILKLFAVVAMLQGIREILPTSHRTLGIGIGHAVGNAGFLLSSISVDYLYHVNKYAPFAIAHGLTLSALIASIFFLDETKDAPLDNHKKIKK